MNRRQHPIDDAFRKKLEHYDSNVPRHLWEGIERQRNVQLKIRQQTQQRRLIATLLLIGGLAGVMSWYTRSSSQPELSRFPIFSERNAGLPIVQNDPSNNIQLNSELVLPIVSESRNATTNQNNNQNKLNITPIEQTATPVENLTETLTKAFVNDPANSFPASAMQASALQITALPIALQQIEAMQSPQIQASGCADFKGGKTKFYFDIMAAPGFAARSLDAKGSDYAKYASTRKETESPRYTYSAALRLSAVTAPGIALRTGVNYSEINERFEHTIENEVRTIITNIYGQNGEIIGTDTTVQTTSRQIVANNRYRTLDVPLLVGYEVNAKNLTLSLNGGAYINVMFSPDGEFISPENNHPVSFSNDNNSEAYPAFRKDLGIGWYGSLGVQYRVSPRLQLLVEPHIKAYPRSFTREDFMIDQKYLMAGVFVGIRHQFQL